MKRAIFSIGTFLSFTAVLWSAHVPSALAANPNEVVVFSCSEGSSGYTVNDYNNSPGAPVKPSTDCATTVEALLTDGLLNVNISVQTWSATSGAPQGITGTYITYVMANGTLTGGNL
jgi:hypothetical protein